MQYTQVTQKERYQITAHIARKQSIAWMATTLQRHESTIRREIQRNGGWRGYDPDQAQRMSTNRARCKGYARKKLVGLTLEIVINCLRLYWSPEQISGRL